MIDNTVSRTIKIIPPPLSTSRVVWLDYAKVFGMLLVIIGHLPFKFNFVISLFHMPLFFMLSGYLYKRRCVKEELSRSFKALIIPYVFYNIIIGVVHILVFQDSPCDLLRNIALSEQEHLPYSFRAMWFLISLFTMRVVSSFVGKYSFIGSIFLFASCCIFKHIYDLDYIVDDPFQITSTLLCYVFFELGRCLKYLKSNSRFNSFVAIINSLNTRNILCAYTLVFTIIVLFVRLNHFREVNLFRSFYGDYIIVFFVVAIAITLMYVHTISKLCKHRNRMIEDLSNGMIFILCSHQLIITLCNEFLKFNNITSILFASLYMCLSIYPIRFFKKYIPMALGK